MDLSRFEKMVYDLRATNGSNEKREILAQYPLCVELLKIILDPYQKFNITKSAILKYTEDKDLTKENLSHYDIPAHVDGLISFLEDLSERKISGNKAKIVCNLIIRANPQFTDLLLDIFDKDLKIGMGATEVNKVYKGLVPRFDVSLATKTKVKGDPLFLENLLKEINLEMGEWTMQRKLDGLRVIILCEKGILRAFSRYGNPVKSINAVLNVLHGIVPPSASFALDGEICIMENGVENFNKAQSEFKRKDVQMSNPKYVMFDIVPISEFRARIGKGLYRERYGLLVELFRDHTSDTIDIIKTFPYSEVNFSKMMDIASTKKWEGLMLKKNTVYKGQRTTDTYKIKHFQKEEYVVESVNFATINMYDPVTKIKRPEEAMKSVNIRHDGNIVVVGSGWGDDLRRKYFKNPEEIIGKTISVQYQEECEAKTHAGKSLRLPTLACVWENGRDA